MGQAEGKLHPKLRMIANGDEAVNCLRAEQSQTLVSTLPVQELFAGTPLEAASSEAGFLALNIETEALPSPSKPPRRRKLTDQTRASQAHVGVFIEVYRDRLVAGPGGTASDVEGLMADLAPAIASSTLIDSCLLSKRNFIAATVPVSELPKLAEDERIAFIHPAEALALDVPRPRRAIADLKPSRRQIAAKHDDGAGVIIGIIDVGGFDFAHRDFVANDKSRFLSIWDQGGRGRPPPSRRSGQEFGPFNVGSEILRADMDKALEIERGGGLAATSIEPQSQQVRSSHATHVASIAAGNSGLCSKADIAAVLLNIPVDPKAPTKTRRETFSDSTRLVLAIEYLLEVAKRENKPISINISLGTNGGAHDGSGGVSRWFDALLATEGRSIAVAAGNAGQEAATTESPNGWMMGRIHASGKIPSRGLVVDLDWTVVGDQIVDLSENELEIWYSAQDRIRIAVRPPGSDIWLEVGPREYIENKRLASGTFVSVYNELYNPVNGANYCSVYLSPDLRAESLTGVAAGTWTIRLIGEEVRNGEFHCWIERDDPQRFGPGGGQLMRMPSFFSATSNVDSHSINSLACGHRVIAVANLDDAKQRIAASSSQGPTRDARTKPDIAAPGTNIVAANGFAEATEPWVAMSGTSMASPYVAGIAGLMLSIDRKLTSAQCSAILQRTSRPLPGGSYEWKNDAGFGAIDAAAALTEAASFSERKDVGGSVDA